MERRVALTVGSIATLGMVAAIAYGMVSGGFAEGFRTVLANPWGRVSLVDLGAGFLLAGAWVGWRERSLLRSVPWWMAILVTGNLAVGAYVLRAAWKSATIGELLIGSRR